MAKEIKEFGHWPSKISAEMLSGSIRLNDVQWSRGGDTLIWSQSFEGQTVLMAKPKGQPAFALTNENNRPSGGIAYGGGEFFAGEDCVIFCDRDGRLYSKPYHSSMPNALTPAFGSSATPILSHDHSFIIYAHSYETRDVLAAVHNDGKSWPVILTQGANFYLNPTLNLNDQWLAWIEWNHPNMPWDGTSLKLAKLDPKTLSLSDIQTLDGFGQYACYQAQFSPSGRYLVWLANNAEFDDLILYDLHEGKKKTLISQKCLIQPAWIAGQRTLSWGNDDQSLYFIENNLGQLSLKEINLLQKDSLNLTVKNVDIGPFTWLDQLMVSANGEIAFIAESYCKETQVVTLCQNEIQTIVKSSDNNLTKDWYSKPESFSWKSSENTTVHGFYYPPANPNVTNDSAPPLIVHVHGGPSSQEYDSYILWIHYFTSRGYAVFVVNYRGSTGYGKSYRDALRKNWGKIDLLDCIEGTQALIKAGKADPTQLVIMGGSSGGYTVLNALIRYPGLFKLGINRYGVSNLFMLEEDTHKFESHYNTTLLGPLPEFEAEWRALSPAFHADKIKDALLIF